MTIDLVVSSTYPGNKLQFPDIPELRSDTDKDAVVFSMQVYHNEITPNTFNGNPVATWAQLQNAVLTLYVIGVEQQFNIPLPRLLNMQSSVAAEDEWWSRQPFLMAPERIDWTKSYVQSCSGNLAGNTNYSIYLEVEYEWMPVGSYGAYLEARNSRWLHGNIKD